MTLYLSRDLRALQIPWLSPAQAPLILWSVQAGESVPVPMYRLTPLLYAALIRHCDRLDAAHEAGQIPAAKMAVIVDRFNRVQEYVSECMDWQAVQKAKGVLEGQAEPLTWVVEQYVARMGGREAVAELERLAHADPWPAETGTRVAVKMVGEADGAVSTDERGAA